MPTLTVQDIGSVEVPAGTRLINALIDNIKTEQLHACGGNARCTTCRVLFTAGEPEAISQAEKELITTRGLSATPGLRLSCQIKCDHDMTVKLVSILPGSGRKDAGGKPADDIQPPPVWTTK